mmetsp:Transcript_35289/g.76152  ORF Transcript_35289/g.76152 Transcript_35289/m.76152 type:complete len:380 (-) Transcript_35289:81-1220(-)
MGVVHLNGDLLGKFRPLPVGLLDELAQEILQGGAHEEVLLLQSQELALVLVVVGVEDSREILGLASVVDSLRVAELVECLEVKLLGRKGPPKSQVVGIVGVEARDGIVIGHGLDDLATDPASPPATLVVRVVLNAATEAHWVGHIRTRDLPRHGLGKPVVGLLDLPTVDDVLLEDAIAVSDAIAPARERQSGHGVQEAGGQSAETSVAETGVGFEGVELLEFEAKAGQSILEGRLQIQVDQGILECTAEQVLSRKVVGPLDILLGIPVVGVVEALKQTIPDCERGRSVCVLFGEVESGAGQLVLDLCHDVFLDGLHIVRLVAFHELPELGMGVLALVALHIGHRSLGLVPHGKEGEGRLSLHVEVGGIGVPNAAGGHGC